MKTITPIRSSIQNKSKISFYLLILFIIALLQTPNYGMMQEWLMQITSGGTPVNANIYLYYGGQLIRQGNSIAGPPWAFNDGTLDSEGNFGCDVQPYIGANLGNDNTSNTWDIVDPRNYTVRIKVGTVTDIFFVVQIPAAPGGRNDFNIGVNLSNKALTFIYNGRGANLGSTTAYNWIDYNVTVKNSFNADGLMSVDYNNVSIPAVGKTYSWATPWFPHRLSAIDQKPATLNYWQRFQNWSTGSTNRSISISAGNNSYQANFKNEYNVTFQNSFSGASGGVITVNNIQYNAPYQTTLLQYDSISATAATNSINGISYSFSHWSDGSAQGYNYYFKPNDHSTYTAYYIGKATNANRNLHFNSSDPNQPITVIWNEHPNTYVTKYQIWRRSKYKKGVTSEPVLIGTVNRGTTTFVDYEYAGTNSGFTDWILWYDVKSYFSLDATYSDDEFVLVFSDGLLAKKNGNISNDITENKIENYPNPFNPSTLITFQIVKSGYVTLKIYDNLGKEIETLVNEEKNSGIYNVVFDGTKLSSGIYFYRIITNGYTETKKMILTK